MKSWSIEPEWFKNQFISVDLRVVLSRFISEPRHRGRAASMVISIAAMAVAVVVPLLLLTPPAGAAEVLGWGVVAAMAVQGTAAALAAREGTLMRALLHLAVPLWTGALVFIWATGLVDQASCGAGAAAILIFATSEFGRAAGVSTLGLLAGAGGACMYAVGGWAQVALMPVFVAALGLVLALTLQLVADHDRVTAQLEAVAGVDALTGLVTRRVLGEALSSALSASASGAGTGLLLVDVDEFKKVNDVHGHPGGDAALQHVARVLTAAVRSGDAVVCRLGGDEMAVPLPGCSVQVLARRAGDLVRAVRQAPVTLPDGTVRQLTISVGAAHASTHGEDVQVLYAAADEALYSCKGRHAGSEGLPDRCSRDSMPLA